MGANEKVAATFHGQDAPDTAALRRAYRRREGSAMVARDVTALCYALDAATARANAAEAAVERVRVWIDEAPEHTAGLDLLRQVSAIDGPAEAGEPR